MAIENEQFEMIMMETMERADKTISVLNSEYVTIRAGRANPHILDKVLVDFTFNHLCNNHFWLVSKFRVVLNLSK